MQAEWKGHTISIRGNWTARWLWLAPDYELLIDDESVDRTGGPRLHPKLEAVVEDEDGDIHHIEAEILSVIGWRPSCELTVEGEVLDSGTISVDNFLNPFLILVIIASTIVMLWVGPDVLRQYF